jgi:hypothetical protein
MKSSLTSLTLAAGLFFSGAAQATLIDRGGGLIYDDVLNITWLQDANYAKTQYDNSGGTLGDADGRMDWATAKAWAADLSYYDSVRGVTYDDWRLPTLTPIGASFNYNYSNNGSTDIGYGITSTHSELAYMYYVNLANLGYYAPNGGGSSTSYVRQSGYGLVDGPALNDESLFTNLQSSVYWYGLEFAPNTFRAWYFYTSGGDVSDSFKSNSNYAWAVRPGDVTAAPAPSGVPESGTVGLLALGLLGLGLARRRG